MVVNIVSYDTGPWSEDPREKGGRVRGEELGERNDSSFRDLRFDSRGDECDYYDVSKRGECDEAWEDAAGRSAAAEYFAEERGGHECGPSSVAEFRFADHTKVRDVSQDVQERYESYGGVRRFLERLLRFVDLAQHLHRY